MNARVKPGLYIVPLPSKKLVWVHVMPPPRSAADEAPSKSPTAVSEYESVGSPTAQSA
jgi:hypothetical protein